MIEITNGITTTATDHYHLRESGSSKCGQQFDRLKSTWNVFRAAWDGEGLTQLTGDRAHGQHPSEMTGEVERLELLR
jgi:hypothetical protein